MIVAALLVWQGWTLTGWISRFRTDLPTLLNAGRQYYDTGAWSAAALAENWGLFTGAIVGFAGVVAVAAMQGAAALRVCSVRRRIPGLNVATGLGLLGTTILGAGLLGLLIAPPRWPVLIGLGAIGIRSLIRQHAARMALLRAMREAVADAALSLPVRLVLGLSLVTAACAVLNIEMAWDAMTYHLRIPSFYLGHHKIYNVWHHAWSTFPSQIEMLFALGQLLHGDILARLISALLGVLLLVAGFDLARACGMRGGLSLVLVVASPVWLLLLHRAYIDTGFALFLTLSLRLLLVRLTTGSLPALLGSALLAGFGLSCKYVGVVFLPAVLAAGWPLVNSAAGRRDAVRWCTLAFLPLAAWLARNYLDRGNPVSPMLGGLFGTHEILPGDVTPFFQQEHPLAMLIASAPERCLALLENAGRIDGPLVAAIAGLIPLLLLRAPAGAAARAVRRAALGYTAGWWLLAVDSRFYLPALPWVAVLIEEGWLAMRAVSSRSARLISRVLLEGALATGALYGTFIIWTFFAPFAMPLGFDTSRLRHQISLPPAPFNFYMKEHINAATPPDARIWYLANFCTYYVDRECLADFHFGSSQFTRFARTHPTAGAMAKGFRQRGFDYLLSTGHEAAQYLEIPGYFDLPSATWSQFRILLATRAEVEWQSETYVLFRLTRMPHPPRPLPAFPLLEAVIWQQADQDLSGGRTTAALRAFLAPPPLLADIGSTFVRQGDAWMVLANLPRAESAFRQALAAGTDNPRVHAGIAQARLQQGDPRGALPHAEAAFRQHPLSAFNAASLSQIYAALGRQDDARRLIRTAVALLPQEPQYHDMARRLGAE